MCGRYELVAGQLIFTRFRVRHVDPDTGADADTVPVHVLDRHDVRPSQQVPVVVLDHELQYMKWGLVPAWARDEKIGYKMINARAETIADKPSFKRALRSQRCLIPASAFFEWAASAGASSGALTGSPGRKTKYRIARRDGDLMALAGLYDRWKSPMGEELATCTIITTTPNAVMAPIHTRMPVILLPDEEDAWLNPDLTEPDQIVEYLRPYPDDLLEAEAVA